MLICFSPQPIVGMPALTMWEVYFYLFISKYLFCVRCDVFIGVRCIPKVELIWRLCGFTVAVSYYCPKQTQYYPNRSSVTTENKLAAVWHLLNYTRAHTSSDIQLQLVSSNLPCEKTSYITEHMQLKSWGSANDRSGTDCSERHDYIGRLQCLNYISCHVQFSS